MDSEGSGRSTKQSEVSKQQVPVAVEAVVRYGYAQDLVLSVYQTLSSGSSHDVTQSGDHGNNETDGASGGIPMGNVITAASLLTSVEAVLGSTSASGNGSSHQRGPSSLMTTSKRWRGDGWADSDLERDGPSDAPARFPGSETSPHQGTAAVNNTETNISSPSTSTTTTSAITSASDLTTITNIPAEASAGSTSSSRNPATSLDMARQSHDSPVSPAPAGDTTIPQQLQSQVPAEVFSNSSSPNARVTEGDTTAADERAKERKHQLNRLRALRAENRRLKARQMCRKCRHEPVDLTFLPCGHFLFCQPCGSSFDTCPACRKTVLADVKTFVS